MTDRGSFPFELIVLGVVKNMKFVVHFQANQMMKTAFDELVFTLNVVNAVFEIVEGKQSMLEIKVL